MNSLCDLKSSSLVLTQGDNEMKENVDNLCELEAHKESKDKPDNVNQRTSSILISPQDYKENKDSLCNLDFSSRVTPQDCKALEENANGLCEPEVHKETDNRLDDVCEPTSSSLPYPQGNKENVGSFCKLESTSYVDLKNHKEAKHGLYSKCEPTYPSLISPQGNKGNVEGLCNLESFSLVPAQHCKELEENADSLCELEAHKETDNNLDDICEPTSSNLISPQDNKENVNSVCEFEPHKVTEDNLDDVSEIKYPSSICPQDNKENVENFCEPESTSHEGGKIHKGTKDSLHSECNSSYPSLLSPHGNKENVDGFCNVGFPNLVAPKEPKETEGNLGYSCEPKSSSLKSLQDNEENVDSLCNLESFSLVPPQHCKVLEENPDGLWELKAHNAKEGNLDDVREPTSTSLKPLQDNKENVDSLCNLESSNHVTPQDCKELEENADSLCEFKAHKESEDNLDDMCEPTTSSLISPQDNKENVENFCELESTSHVDLKKHKETEENLHSKCEPTRPSLLSPQDNKENADSLCNLDSSSLVPHQDCNMLEEIPNSLCELEAHKETEDNLGAVNEIKLFNLVMENKDPATPQDCNKSGENAEGSSKIESHNPVTPEVPVDLCKAIESEERTEEQKDLFPQTVEPDCKKIPDEKIKPLACDTSEDLHELHRRRTTLLHLAEKMNMEPYLTTKLTLMDILSIGSENVHDKPPKNVEDLPWNYLRKLMALNGTARDIRLEKDQSADVNLDNSGDNDVESLFNTSLPSASIHPLDVLCVLLHCSDSFLQQEIVTKLSMCQFAVPLLLPSGDGSQCTLMLWAMRDIVKKWRPQSLADSKGFREENVVNTSMPIFSYVKLGKNKLSKSKTLNQVLNPAQLHNNFFIHDSMKGGNIERKISDGLVEVSWYFPCGKSDVFPEPIAVTNLRGDLETNWDQFTFLTRISSAVFIFIEDISEREFSLLSSFPTTDTQYYFIVTPGPGKTISTQTKMVLQELMPVLKLKKTNLIIHAGTANEAAFVKKLERTIINFLNSKPKEKKMRDFEKETHGLSIQVDENITEFQKAREHARKITEEINVSEYKKNTMKLQGDLWRQLSKLEKELCRMTKQDGKDTQQYQDELIKKRISLHEEQYNHDLPHGLMLFIDAITHLSEAEKQYFLKWMKFELDSIARNHLSKLQAEYKKNCNNILDNKEKLRQIDQEISDSSLGIEHFLREMGQFYEAECSMVQENKIKKIQRQFTRLPGIAADLLLDGFPLELIDGDASNIPLWWITDVFSELESRTGGKCRMRVISVLGVQSTGKSTLLNTMFGLQFPVASGRCTRGAFMTLLNVKKNFQEELGCDFILIIDTEGLKAPELASLEGSYEHDNELATLVIGLSDITIVNMAMENTTEMKDILQIVVHAFLRMKEIGKKPKCQFVHQNVSDVSAHDKNMRDRKKLLEQLNEMTKVAAEMEKKSEIKTFSDMMDYNLEKDNWYIPGLWLGVPPMAPVNSGYSEHVSELKKYLLELMTYKGSLHRPLIIPEFITWIESLWKAVKHEKFIFSFRNSLVAEAYNKLSIQYSQWDWEFRKSVHDWMIRTETKIRNQTAESLSDDLCSEFKNELNNLLFNRESKVLESLKNYFNNKNENVHLIEQYKQDFILSTQFLKEELKRNSLVKLDEAVLIQRGKFKIQNIQTNSQKLMEGKITDLLKRCREMKKKLNNEELKREFEGMWERTLTDLQIEELKTRIVSRSMFYKLMNDMSNKGSAVNQHLLSVKDLADITQTDFKMDEKYIAKGWFTKLTDKFRHKNELFDKINGFARSLIDNCNKYIREKVETGEDYCDNYCQELLHMITTEISKQSRNLHLSSWFEVDIKLHILRKASKEFQAMHEKFIRENDPKVRLEKLKSGYLETFISIFQEKDICQTKAKEFCERCLKPAMMDHVFHYLGQKIVDDIEGSPDNKKFSSRTFFQEFLMKELLKEMSFQKYADYMRNYEKYTKAWILNYTETYTKPQILKPLQENLLSSLDKKINGALTEDNSVKRSTVSDFLKSVCEILKEELVIPQNEMQAVTFQNTADVGQFSSDIQLFLRDTETEVLSDLQSMDIKSVLSRVTVKPQDELFRKVVGCGKQCPFCAVPCEAGGDEHKEHFATIHRPKGLGRCIRGAAKILITDNCSTSVVSDGKFQCLETEGKWHPYREYRTIFPDWSIQPDPSIKSSDYWKYIFLMFNEEFAEEYKARPAEIPDGWKSITREEALQSLKKMFNS
ncbi:interferon-induced very large GTPase 1-like [Aquarana catesbeiana]|uniref:interferon-induced very large GTPase 1-like n=1 Tax=Aquarana catesbeiana TaxID=8400 RepID=UPI003CCA6B11